MQNNTVNHARLPPGGLPTPVVTVNVVMVDRGVVVDGGVRVEVGEVPSITLSSANTVTALSVTLFTLHV